MLSSLYAKLAGLALVLAALGGLFLWGHHAGAAAQAAKDAATIQRKNEALQSASASLSAVADVLRTMDAQAKQDAAHAAELQRQAQTAATEAESNKAERAKSEQAWRKRFDQLKQSTGCKAILEQTLCPALSGY